MNFKVPFKEIKDSTKDSFEFIFSNPLVVTLYILFVGAFHFYIPPVADLIFFIYIGSAMFFFMAAQYIGLNYRYIKYTLKDCSKNLSILSFSIILIYLSIYSIFVLMEYLINKEAIAEGNNQTENPSTYMVVAAFILNKTIDGCYYFYFLCYVFWFSHIKIGLKATISWTSFYLLKILPLLIFVALIKFLCVLVSENYIKVSFMLVSSFSDILVAHVFFKFINLPKKPKKKKAKSRDKAFNRNPILDA